MLCAIIPGDHTTVRVSRDITEMEGTVNQVRLNGHLIIKGMFKEIKSHVDCAYGHENCAWKRALQGGGCSNNSLDF